MTDERTVHAPPAPQIADVMDETASGHAPDSDDDPPAGWSMLPTDLDDPRDAEIVKAAETREGKLAARRKNPKKGYDLEGKKGAGWKAARR